jgi:hypothetical protein
MLDTLTVAMFAECLGTTFRIRTEPEVVLEIVLLEANALTARGGSRGGAMRREPFSLIFRGPRGPWLPQRIHRLEHDKLGTLDIFLVPIGPDEQGMRYEAIFN